MHEVNFVTFFVGITCSVVATVILKRYEAYRAARVYEGVFVPEEIDGHETRPMPDGSLAVVKARSFWSRNPGVLDSYAYDITPHGNQEHVSRIVPNPSSPNHALRTVEYLKLFEVSQQEIEMVGRNHDLLVMPVERSYNRHLLRRLRGPLFLH